MSSDTSGIYQYQKPVTSPVELEAWLAKNPVLTPDLIAELFVDFTPESISLTNCSFSAGGCDAFASEISKSVTLMNLSFDGLTINEHFNMQTILNSLIENLSIQSVSLENCNFSEQEALIIASSVIPWNKTIVEWNFSGNLIGDSGARAISGAFSQAMSSVQKCSLKGCGITDVGAVLAPFLGLTSIYQLDFAQNPGYNETIKKALDDLDQNLMRNAQLLCSGNVKHVPLTSSMHPPATTGSPSGTPTKKAPRTSMVKKPSDRQRGTSVSKNETTLVKNDSFSGTLRGGLPPKKSTTSHPTRSSGPPSPSEKKEETAAKSNAAPEATKEEKKDAAQEGENNEASGEQKAETEKEKPSHPSVRKANTSQRRAHSAPRASSQRTASPSQQQVVQEQINDDLEKWREVQKQYNGYIRQDIPNKKTHEIYRGESKFLLGQRLDRIKERPSSAFRTGYTRSRERAPTPSEIRKYAPWNAKEKQAEEAPVGAVHHVVLPTQRGKESTVITFINGGDLTYLNDDPRDMGYLARKCQTGQSKPKPTLFLSNTPREVRWGCSESQKGYVHKKAQAPGPGYYTVESEWDRRARKLKENQRNTSATSKPMFGGAASERKGVGVVKHNGVPGPGFYEIP